MLNKNYPGNESFTGDLFAIFTSVHSFLVHHSFHLFLVYILKGPRLRQDVMFTDDGSEVFR